MSAPDGESEGHREVPGQGFGELSKYPLPTCPTEAHADPDAGEAPNEYGIADSKEVSNPTTINGYGFGK